VHDHSKCEGFKCNFCKGSGFNGNVNCFHCKGTGRLNSY
jgi:DnaJ-class molecular chaperone